jgi:hypothetical protein
MSSFRIDKQVRDGQGTTSAEFESPDAAVAFSNIERDHDCTDADIWQDGKRISCLHRRGGEAGFFWLIDSQINDQK